MDTESRINAIEAELQETKDELKEILFDIRTYLMEANFFEGESGILRIPLIF